MIPLDTFEKWPSSLDACARQHLHPPEYQRYLAIPGPERLTRLKAILETPLAHFTPVNTVFFRRRWAEVLEAAQTGNRLALLEVATGDTDIIPQMLALLHPGSRYIAANMNRILTGRLRRKISALPIEVQIIEEDAVEIDRFLPPESVDIVAFQHAVNDVIQAVLCARHAVDTVDSDWMDTLPRMITIVQQEIAQGTLEQHAAPGFLCLLEKLTGVLKKGGLVVMNHYMFQLDLDWGYPPGLWENFIPITREWIKALPGCQEVFFDGFDPQWWIFLRKT